MARAGAPPHEDQIRKRAGRLVQRLSQVGASQAQRHVAAAEQSGDAVRLAPNESPQQWEKAVELARLVTIARAKRRDTITYGELQWAIYDEMRMLVDGADSSDLAKAIDQKSDGVLLSSIIVNEDDDQFLPYASSMGFDEPVDTLQRQVYEQFR